MARSILDYPPDGWRVARERWRTWWLIEDSSEVGTMSRVVGPFRSRSDASTEARIIIYKRHLQTEVGGDS